MNLISVSYHHNLLHMIDVSTPVPRLYCVCFLFMNLHYTCCSSEISSYSQQYIFSCLFIKIKEQFFILLIKNGKFEKNFHQILF